MDSHGKCSRLEKVLGDTLDKRKEKGTFRSLTTTASSKIDFSSNDFLSLSKSALLHSAFRDELNRSSHQIGSTGSRLLDGNSQYAEDLERDIANFHGAKAGLLFNSGFDANAGFFACVPQMGDIIVYDSLIHASVHEGMKLCRAAKMVPFRHNCTIDLRKILGQCLRESRSLREGKNHVIVAVEAIYSMDGDFAPLKDIVEVVEEVLPPGCGNIVVDEAHSTGVIGQKGRGLVCELRLEEKIFARLHTFGKALACNGAIILGSSTLRSYLINYARPMIYSTFLSFPALAAIRAAYSLLWHKRTEKLATRLRSLIELLYLQLKTIDSPAFKTLIIIPAICPKSPIFGLQTTEPKALASFLQSRGMMARAIVPPTVPKGTDRVRVCLHAGNTEDEIRRLVKSIEAWAESRFQKSTESLSTDSNVLFTARL